MKKLDNLIIAKKKFKSRLIVGTGKYKNMSECAKAIKLSGAEIVTVAVRRVNIVDKNKPLLMDYINPKKITYLPNTAGCFNSKEALRTLRLAREIGGWKLVKLEVLGDKKTLFPDMIETLKSTEVLTKEGFKVMVYCTDDPLMAKRLENVGACAIMPLAAPIGSGLGIQNYTNIKIIRNQTKLPLIIDAGLGQASDATIAMELGCDGVLVNTAIAKAKNPFQMALAFKNSVVAGRQSYLSGRIEKFLFGTSSSPKEGIFNANLSLSCCRYDHHPGVDSYGPRISICRLPRRRKRIRQPTRRDRPTSRPVGCISKSSPPYPFSSRQVV